MISSGDCAATWSAPSSFSPCTWVSGLACTGRSPPTALDPDAIAAARRNAAQAGLSGHTGRVTFAVTDASGPGWAGRYDLVTIFEGLHDMARPVDALRTALGMRPAALRRYAREAGFAAVEVLPVQTEDWRFYRLTPGG